MSPAEILSLSCVQLAAAIRERRTSAVAAMEAVLERAREVQPKLNCFLRIDESSALEAARLADRGPSRGPLHGVPMAHKDMYYRRGVISSCGSRILRERPAPATATAAVRASSSPCRARTARMTETMFRILVVDACRSGSITRVKGGAAGFARMNHAATRAVRSHRRMDRMMDISPFSGQKVLPRTGERQPLCYLGI